MTLDEWIDELRYGDLDSIKDRLDAIELIEFLEELKRSREFLKGTGLRATITVNKEAVQDSIAKGIVR